MQSVTELYRAYELLIRPKMECKSPHVRKEFSLCTLQPLEFPFQNKLNSPPNATRSSIQAEAYLST